MKAGALAPILSDYASALRKSEAGEIASALDELATILAKHPNVTASKILRPSANVRASRQAGDAPTARDVLGSVTGLRNLLRSLAKKSVAKGLDELVLIVEKFGDTPISAMVSENVVSASGKGKGKGPTPVEQTFIDDYVQELEAALGNEDTFQKIYRGLQNHARSKKAEIVAIANRFNGPVSPSTTPSKALQKILARHRKLVDFDHGSVSIGGKAA